MLAGVRAGSGVAPGTDDVGQVAVVSVMDDYERSLIAGGMAEKSWAVYVQSAIAYCRTVDPMTAQARDVEEYLVGLCVGRNTLAQYHARLKRFHAFLVREGYRADNPLDRLQRPKIARGVPRPMPDEWIEAIWEIATPVERAWITLGLYCGLRAGEAVAVRVEDIEGDELVVRGKGDKVRRLPIRPEVFAALDVVGWPRSGRFFPRASEKAASIAIGDLLRQVGAPDRFSYHSLRHRAGTAWYQASRDVKVTAELLGHSSLETTLVYAQTDLDHARWVAGQVPTIVGGQGRDSSVPRQEGEGAARFSSEGGDRRGPDRAARRWRVA